MNSVVSPTEDDIGTYLLLLKLEDDNTCGDALGIKACEVYFELEITNQENQTPTWSGSFSSQQVTMGETLEIFLPGFSDPDLEDEHTVEVHEEGASSLPPFVTYNSEESTLLV